MELRQIQYFMQLYADQNITKASQKLYISQQGLSKSILHLEKELDFPLFDRTVSGVHPTESANRLYRFFQNVCSSYANLNSEIEKIRQNRTVKIAAPIGFSLSCNCRQLLTCPDLETTPSYKEYDGRLIPDCLETQKADAAYMIGPIPENLRSHLIISSEPFFAVVPAGHPLAGKHDIRIEDLNGQELFLLDLFESFNASILKAADDRQISYSISGLASVNELLPLISSGSCLGFSTKPLLWHFHFPDILFIPITLDGGSVITVDTHLVTSKKNLLYPELQQYINYGKKLYQNT